MIGGDKKMLEELRFIAEPAELDLEGALAWARANISRPAWILSEAPEKVIWRGWDNAVTADSLGHCLKLFVFNGDCELRLERYYYGDACVARIVRRDEDAPPTYARISSYLLARGRGRLEYAEHFRRDPASGALRPLFARFCGVRGA